MPPGTFRYMAQTGAGRLFPAIWNTLAPRWGSITVSRPRSSPFVTFSSAPSEPLPMHSRKVCSRAVIALAVSTFMLAAPLAAQTKGYTLDDILGLLRRHVASTRVLSLAKTSCVTFEVTDDVAA